MTLSDFSSLPLDLQKKLEQAQQEDQVQAHQEQLDALKHIVALIEEVRRCWTPVHYRTAQQHLGGYIERVDSLAEEANSRRKRINKQLQCQPHRRHLPDSDTATKLEHDRQQAELERELYVRLGRQYRMVGDALAWQLYEFEALPLYALGMNQDPGPISHSRKPGADAEQETVEQFWQEHGAFALRHDYTNCLRVWDLSVFFPNGSRAIQEVKVKKSVSSSQKRKGRMVVELIKHHESTLPEGNLLIHQRRPSPESNGNVQTNLELLWQALLQAAQQSIGFAANTYLAIIVFDMTNPAKRPRDQLFQEWLQRTQSLIPSDIWPLHSVDVLRSTSRERVSYPCFGAPYTVYPLPSHIVARIVTGYLQVHYQLNTAAITQAFRDKGFEAECLLGEWRRQGLSQPKKTPEPYFRLRRGDATMTISRLTMEQITFEGLRLEDVIEAVIAADEERTRLAASPSRHHFGLLSTYTNMEQVWRTSRKVITPNAAGETESEECEQGDETS